MTTLTNYREQKPIEMIKNIFVVNKDKFANGVVFLFGSRARWENKKYSDYDIGYDWKKLNIKTIANIKSQLSTLPRKIDFVDFNYTDETFKKIALQDTINIL